MRSFLKIVVLCVILASPLSAFEEMNGVFKWLFFSDKLYAKEIEVKAYILTEKQAADLLADPSVEPVQFTGVQLGINPNYLVIRVKNLGNKHAWGTLACRIPGVTDPIYIPTIAIGKRRFCNYLISVDGIAVAFPHDTFPPEIKFEWEKLYTK